MTSKTRAKAEESMPDVSELKLLDDVPPMPSREEIDRRLAATGYTLEAHTAHMIRLAHQRGTALFQKAFEGYSITPTQVAVLATLARFGDTPQNKLGRITAIDTATLSPMLRRLQDLGFTERISSQQDQRVNLVRITPRGMAFILEVLPISQDISEQVLAPLKPRDRKRFIELLKQII